MPMAWNLNMEYLQEHDHEAEQLISTLSLNPEDDELDVGELSIHNYTCTYIKEYFLKRQIFVFNLSFITDRKRVIPGYILPMYNFITIHKVDFA